MVILLIYVVDVVRECGLFQVVVDEGWLLMNYEILQVYGVDWVYILGDIVDLLVSKVGGVCYNQVLVVVSNIVVEICFGKFCVIYDG